MREIVHLQAGQCGNQIGAKSSSRRLPRPRTARLGVLLEQRNYMLSNAAPLTLLDPTFTRPRSELIVSAIGP
ncbi:hypothetical protein EVAR_54390_1 [Eumeta japonica]|uniref:Uncharacterized protein n=1 Tax=Eumeta variegata TaxID=151549 RepID=A0A4C1Y4Z8_EUMVA|nr:hypothetical protein EVAR_54390_1 [Eumeta japonica]